MSENKFGFQPNLSSMESYLKENERFSAEGQQGGPNWWSIPSGTSCIRVLPPWDATGRVALAVYSHPIEFQGKNMKYKKYSWTCVNRTFGKPCNICQGLQSISESGVDTSSYEPNRRTFYLNALVMFDPVYDNDIRSGKKPEDSYGVAPGTHVLVRVPKTVYDWIVSSITNPMIGDITSVTNGIDIMITKEGQGLGTEYRLSTSPNGRTAIPQEYLDKIESLYNLDEIFSTGFEQDQVNELVESLRRSSNYMNNNMAYTSAQMSGQTGNPYSVPPSSYNQQVPQQMPQQPSFNAPPAPAFGQNVPPVQPAPFMTGAPNAQPFNPQVAPTPTPPSQNDLPWATPQASTATNPADTPECYGRDYNPSNVKCVTCSHEIPCSQMCKK